MRIFDAHDFDWLLAQPLCHFALDVTQSLGAMPFPRWLAGVDYVCGALYKWLLGPYGMGFMFAAPQHHALEPLEYGWMTRANARRFADIAAYTDEHAEGAHRFDMGQRAQLQLLPMALPALRHIVDEWTPRRVYHTLSLWNEQLARRMTALGLEVAHSQHRGGHMMGIRFDADSVSGEEILRQMKKEHFYVSIRAGSIRISPHLFSTQAEYDQLVVVLEAVMLSQLRV